MSFSISAPRTRASTLFSTISIEFWLSQFPSSPEPRQQKQSYQRNENQQQCHHGQSHAHSVRLEALTDRHQQQNRRQHHSHPNVFVRSCARRGSLLEQFRRLVALLHRLFGVRVVILLHHQRPGRRVGII